MQRSKHWTGVVGGVMLAWGILSAWAFMPASGQAAATQGAQTVPLREAQRKNPMPADAGSVATGKQVFAGNCEPCHGATGKGNGTTAHLLETTPADLTASKYAKDSDGTLFWRIGNGHPPMPKFDNTLPEESRWNVVNYVRTLIVPAAAAPASGPGAGQNSPRTP